MINHRRFAVLAIAAAMLATAGPSATAAPAPAPDIRSSDHAAVTDTPAMAPAVLVAEAPVALERGTMVARSLAIVTTAVERFAPSMGVATAAGRRWTDRRGASNSRNVMASMSDSTGSSARWSHADSAPLGSDRH